MNRVLDTPYIYLAVEDGILMGTYKKGVKINIDIAREIVNIRLSFTNQKNLPAIIFNQGVVGMDKAAREFLSSKEGTKGLKAAAIIVDSPFGSFLGNFFLTVNKTSLPVKLFNNAQRAAKWLQVFVA